jgi:DNA-binding response OmpR family regulator
LEYSRNLVRGLVVKSKVLVVEDNLLLAGPLVRLLTRVGFEVAHVDTCEKAREIRDTFDIGVLDLELPDGCGVDLSAELVDRGTLDCVVFFTGSMDEGTLKKASELAPCVRKTDGMEPLVESMRAALSKRVRRLSFGNDQELTPTPRSRRVR